METAQKLRALDASCRIVFVTTSPDFAVDSYDVNAAFYLLKPVTMERVSKALERCHLSAAEAEVSALSSSPAGENENWLQTYYRVSGSHFGKIGAVGVYTKSELNEH